MTGKRQDRRAVNSRQEILDAAELVVIRDGAGHLTLDAVAQECGLSKGGLLYNFPSKEALIQGMVDRLVERAEAEVWELRADFADRRNPTLKAVIASMRRKAGVDRRVSMAILAAAAENPRLLDKVRAAYRRHVEQILAESADPERALLIWFAREGLMLTGMLDINPVAEDLRHRIEACLDRLADEELS